MSNDYNELEDARFEDFSDIEYTDTTLSYTITRRQKGVEVVVSGRDVLEGAIMLRELTAALHGTGGYEEDSGSFGKIENNKRLKMLRQRYAVRRKLHSK